MAGDRTLKTIACLLLNQTRATDSVYRWGGDEFVVLMPEIEEIAARKFMERINKEIEKLLNISFSFGAVSWNSKFSSIEEMLDEADKLTYQEKKKKRAMLEQIKK